MKNVYYPEALEAYRESTEAAFMVLQQAIRERNYKAGNTALKEIRAIIHHMRLSLQEKYGRLRTRPSMGAYQLPSWKDKTPQEILNEFYPLMDFYVHWEKQLKLRVPKELGAQKKATQKELRSLSGFLKALVRKARRTIIKKAPGWWTGDREQYFKSYLSGEDV